MELCRHTCSHQSAGILKILFQEEIKRANTNERRWEPLKMLGTRRGSIK
jgi:hypothetical protein